VGVMVLVDGESRLFSSVGCGLRVVEGIPAEFGLDKRGVLRYFVWYGIVVSGAIRSFAD